MEIPTNDVSLHMHLFYEEVSLDLLEKASKVFPSKKLYLSLNEGSESNNKILKKAEQSFDVDLTIVDNRGNDQWGFVHTMRKNSDDTKFILYMHDKASDKDDWLHDITDIFLDPEKLKAVLKPMRATDIHGIVSSRERLNAVLSIQEVSDTHRSCQWSHRANVVRLMHTVIWLRELQSILAGSCPDVIPKKYTELIKAGYDAELLNPSYTAGNVFLARREVVELAHCCVHDNFFEFQYRPDGNVEHAMERFYYYVSLCLGFDNLWFN